MWFLFVACVPEPTETGLVSEASWSAARPSLVAPRHHGAIARSVIHLHSPWSHDACDGSPLIEGVPDPDCLADLRAGLCGSGIDVAFLTDHPSHAAEQSFEDLFHHQPGDTWIPGPGGDPIASQIVCDDGRPVSILPGIEDELMPVGLARHVASTAEDNDRLYNSDDAGAIDALMSAGATVLVAHTEGRDLEQLLEQQVTGLTGIEIFNLHASFDPGIRADDLGIDPLGWTEHIGAFTSPDAAGVPDLFALGVIEPQQPSLDRWDAMLAVAPTVGVAGADAHQNVLNLELRDGERGDSYRRILSWFSNWLLVSDDSVEAAQQALAAGRLFVVFEILGTPEGLDVFLDTPAAVVEVGGDAPEGGDLVVSCPTLDPRSPQGPQAPELQVTVLRDGLVWREGCGIHPTDGPGAYRIEVSIVPHHLRPFLGEDPEPLVRSYPWIYSNAIRIGGG
ncbi:MAG TPA: hypothetical protein ENK18_07210 [Deltaproteobacteria bacterium]|nr:hypothetical protein [Deltaproteobacteria bacterium]